RGRCDYRIIPKTSTTLLKHGHMAIEATVIDDAFTSRLFAHLQSTHDFDHYRMFLTQERQKQSHAVGSIDTQLAQIAIQQETILMNLSEVTEQALVKRLNERFGVLETTKAELQQKKRALQGEVGIITLQ